MDRMTERQAADLLGHIDALKEKVNVTESVLRRLRIVVAALTALVAIVGIGALVLRQQAQEIEASRIQQCENGNNTRAGQRQIWTFFFEVTSASARAQHTPQAVLDFYDAYVAWITDEVLPARDCSDLSKEYPPPGPPPSYDEALKEALRDEARDEARDN